jgi:hypothetical protein
MADEKVNGSDTPVERPTMTLAQVREGIREDAEVEVDDVRRTSTYVWLSKFTAFEVQTKLAIRTSSPEWTKLPDKQRVAELGTMMDDITPVVIHRSKPWPNNPQHFVVEIFHDTDEVRVYAVPTAAAAASGAVPTPAGTRFTIRKSSERPAYAVDVLWIEDFVEAICNELEAVDNDDNPEDAGRELEREQVIAYCKTMPEGYRMADLIADFEDGTHLNIEVPDDEEEEEEEEEDETDDPEPVAASNGQASPSAAATEPAPAPIQPATPAE